MNADNLFDTEATERLTAVYQTPDIVEQRRITAEALQLARGQRVLDVGCGPGILADELAEQVAPAGEIVGVDISRDMLAAARQRARSNVRLVEADAIALPFDADTFDAAVSVQTIEYIPDIDRALAELRRVLRPGGRLVIVDTDWDSAVWRSNDRDRMRRMIQTWQQRFAHPHLPTELPERLERAGFTVTGVRPIVLLNLGADDDTFSLRHLPMMENFLRNRDIPDADVHAWASDLRTLGDRYFFSLNRYQFTATAPTSASTPPDRGPHPTT